MSAAGRHIVYIQFPYLAAARVRRRDGDSGQPVLITRQVGGVDMVVAGCARAAAFGLAAGMRLADARALCPRLVTDDFDAASDHADLWRLALWARRYSPLTAPGDTGIWLDIAGAEHLFGGTRALVADCLCRLYRSGLRAVAATAPTCGAAWALAHYGTGSQRFMTAPKSSGDSAGACVVRRAHLRQHLAPLPLMALRLAPGVAAKMHDTGLRAIGDIIGLPRAPLAARFGTDLLTRLDQALGDCDESFSPISPPTPLYVRRQFVEPIAAPEDVRRMVHILTDDIAALLQQAGLAARRIRLGWQLVDGLVFAKDVHLSRPGRDRALLHRLMAGLVTVIKPEFGIECGWMEALECSPLAPLDDDLPALDGPNSKAACDAYAGLVDRLVARLGYGAVVRLAPRESWQPETAQSCVLPGPAHYESRSSDWSGWLAATASRPAAPRPIRLLAYPQQIEVTALLPDHPPARFVWYRKQHKILYATGPERIAPAWWQAPPGSLTRDYFCLYDQEGAGFWVYREGLPERDEMPTWYLHGFLA